MIGRLRFDNLWMDCHSLVVEKVDTWTRPDCYEDNVTRNAVIWGVNPHPEKRQCTDDCRGLTVYWLWIEHGR